MTIDLIFSTLLNAFFLYNVAARTFQLIATNNDQLFVKLFHFPPTSGNSHRPNQQNLSVDPQTFHNLNYNVNKYTKRCYDRQKKNSIDLPFDNNELISVFVILLII